MTNDITLADKAIFVSAIILVAALYAIFWSGRADARHGEILVSGEKQYIIDLQEERQIKIDGKLGESIIEIKNGQARFVESPCSNKVCIRTGWIAQVNALAACLPNGVSLHLVGPNARFDSINF